ncbi:Cell envelope-associated transcriptional attenuator LytR-CpsA-Psr [Actinokineospora spheciospongiae]|uniref:Cell envelope-associated transcriptional attenuator LytR-CpsA-Psr n=1 Tax=Actinokineospora spheciospongiae TaxID=909613 RepID=W7IJ35_9PSEU|nr:LCP family protein [Actinokineospora spheciospongiae]EWC60825.1 Cell envelope-associated transcriptional attenuator LytR-CpsA-Psr [Actinokineospora spheciospongiae]
MDERAQPVGESVGPSRWLRAGGALVKSLIALLSAAVVAGTGYGWWGVGDLDANTVTTDVIDTLPEGDGRVPLDGAVDILLVGIDSRTDAYGNPLPKEVLAMLNGGRAEGERNTDTMILVHIPVDGRRAIAFSFPRDSWVDVGEGFGKHKLNSAFVYAYNDARKTLSEQGVADPELDKQATVAGRKNLISTIERLVGGAVTIDRYAEVNLASFYEVTKAIGGVDVCLNNAVDEPKSGARFPAGKQTVSGAAALSFVRQRYELPNGDLDRIVRQQVFLGALANKVLSADMLTDPGKVRELVAAVQKSVVLSSNWNLSTFAAQMQGLSSGNIEFRTIPNQGDAKIGGADVIKVDPAEVARFVASLTSTADEEATTPSSPSDELPTPPTTASSTAPGTPGVGPDVTVDVRNGSTTRGLASTVLDTLVQAGFTPGEVGDAPVRTGTVVQYAPGELANARSVAGSLGGTVSYEESPGLAAARVRVLLGTGFTPGTAAATDQGLFGARLSPDQTTPGTTPPTETAPPAKIDAGSVNCVN